MTRDYSFLKKLIHQNIELRNEKVEQLRLKFQLSKRIKHLEETIQIVEDRNNQ